MTACTSTLGHVKKAYPSAGAARRDLKHSARWRKRKTWPRPYVCRECHQVHVGNPAP